MKIRRLLFPLLLLSLGGAIPPIPVPPEPVNFQCNLPLLRSYMLKGRKKSIDTEPLITCPTVKHSCCSKYDQQRIFHFVNDVFLRRWDDYNLKLLAAFAHLRAFHRTVTKTPFSFRGSIARKYFCTRQAQRLIKYPFSTLYDNLVSEVDSFAVENRDFHQRFFCMLCDGENHRFFDLSSSNKKIFFDTVFCKEHLFSRAAIMKVLNVDLQEYLINLQNVVDCKHYSKSYSLRFYSPKAIQRANTVNQCITYLDTSEFFRYCKPICERIKFSKVFEEGEGDLEFLNETLALLEKNFASEEEGFVAGSKQKSFFKKILAKMNKKKKPRKLEQWKRAARELMQPPVHNELEEGMDAEAKVRLQMKNAVQMFRKKAREERGKEGGVKKTRKRGVRSERRLLDFEGGVVGRSERVLETCSAKSGCKKTKKMGERILSEGATGAAAAEAPKSTPIKPSFDQQVAPFYAEIVLPFRPHRGYVWRVENQPIDFETPQKVFQINLGVNPLNYLTLNFTMTSEEFYKRLFTRRRVEKTNIQVEFLLGDFTEAFWETTLDDLTHEYVGPNPDEAEEAVQQPELTFWQRVWNFFAGIPQMISS